ncbi:hypothetical protein [Arthrobacter sp.]|uniref:hypothetical protein n=1 Tax=Arthrobacter sp. TaxID=1667 RepID=UPI003A8FCB85
MDATFSINARYSASVAPTVRRYAAFAGLTNVLLPASTPLSPRADEQSLSSFLDSIAGFDDEDLASKVLRNRQLTSTRGGIRKAAATRHLATILHDNGVDVLEDVPKLMSDLERVADVEGQLNRVKGSGQMGVRTGYIWMTAGDDHMVKPDRHILRWIQTAIGRRPSVPESRGLLEVTAKQLDVTPWVLDHAIWRHMSGRSVASAK